MGLRRGDCDRAGSSQPPATSGNGERCRLCRRRRRRGGGGEGGGTHATHGSASPPGDRHDGEAGAALRPQGGGFRQPSRSPRQPRRPLVPLCSAGWGRNQEGNWMNKLRTRRRSGSCRPKWLLIRRGPPLGAERGELGPPLQGASPKVSSARLASSPRPLSEMSFASLFQSPNQIFKRESFVQSNVVIYSLVR